MARTVIHPEAIRDLDGIWDYIAEDSEESATTFIRRIENTLSLIAENPETGRTRFELEPELRSFPVGRYVIFYNAVQSGIEVLRVLHGARDIPDICDF